MGCIQTIQNRLRPSNVIAKKNVSEQVEILEPAPDYRWLQVSLAMIMNNSFRIAMGATRDNLEDWVINSHDCIQHVTASNYPSGWTVFCINVRSGDACRISVITLAINLSVRAETLAQAFGVVTDPSDTNGPRVLSLQTSEPLPERVRRPIYSNLKIPDFGWTLLRRNDAKAVKQRQEQVLKWNAKNADQPETTKIAPPNIQILESGTGRKFYVDIPTIGMNIAEQLFRLERKQDRRELGPFDTFGWEVISDNVDIEHQFEVQVKSREGEIISLVPEEMIMNVTQWVQQTYLTSDQF